MPRAKKQPAFEGETLIAYLLDASGSMASVRQQAIDGFNEYIQGLRAQEEDGTAKFKVTLTTFNTMGTTARYVNVGLDAVEPLDTKSYVPDGGTPLYDAIRDTLQAMDKYVCEHNRILFVIMTDGHENASEYTRAQAQEMITSRQSRGNWTFIYMGANQDAWDVGQSLGVYRGNTLTYAGTARGTTAVMDTLRVATQNYAAAPVASTQSLFDDTGNNTAPAKHSRPKAKRKEGKE